MDTIIQYAREQILKLQRENYLRIKDAERAERNAKVEREIASRNDEVILFLSKTLGIEVEPY